MKKVIAVSSILAAIFIGQNALAGSFTKNATNGAQILQHTEHSKKCTSCGMKLPMFWKTSHALKLKDNTYIQFCSIRDMAKYEKDNQVDVQEYLAVDVPSEKLMDASQMYYVVGSSIKGTMSKVSKLAFKNKQDAINFQKQYGGKIKNFEETKAFTLEILQDDIEMIKKKKAMKKMEHHH